MDNNIRLIKKYPNRRLYDTSSSSYITLDDVKELVLNHNKFKIIDTRSNEDVTNYILLQIISEQETSGSPLFTTEVLQNIIRFYGNSMQSIMSHYLEKTIAHFTDQQTNFQKQLSTLLNKTNPVNVANEFANFNKALWDAFLDKKNKED